MNKLIITVAFSGLVFLSKAQKIEGAKITYQPCSNFAISKPISEMPVAKDVDKEDDEKEEIKIRRRPQASLNNKKAAQFAIDPIAQTSNGNKVLASTIANWQGTNGTASPPD